VHGEQVARLHGSFARCRRIAGVPTLAVDPVAGGGKVSAQARAWGWCWTPSLPAYDPRAFRPAAQPQASWQKVRSTTLRCWMPPRRRRDGYPPLLPARPGPEVRIWE